jgi:hypothetical protein
MNSNQKTPVLFGWGCVPLWVGIVPIDLPLFGSCTQRKALLLNE